MWIDVQLNALSVNMIITRNYKENSSSNISQAVASLRRLFFSMFSPQFFFDSWRYIVHATHLRNILILNGTEIEFGTVLRASSNIQVIMEATFLDDGNRHPVKRRQRIESCTQGNSYLFIHNVCQQLLQVKGFRSQRREMLSTYRWSRSLGTRYKSSLTRCLALNTPLTAPCEIGWD